MTQYVLYNARFQMASAEYITNIYNYGRIFEQIHLILIENFEFMLIIGLFLIIRVCASRVICAISFQNIFVIMSFNALDMSYY